MRIFILRSVKASNGRFRLSGSRRRHRPCDQGYKEYQEWKKRCIDSPCADSVKKKKKVNEQWILQFRVKSTRVQCQQPDASYTLHPAPCTFKRGRWASQLASKYCHLSTCFGRATASTEKAGVWCSRFKLSLCLRLVHDFAGGTNTLVRTPRKWAPWCTFSRMEHEFAREFVRRCTFTRGGERIRCYTGISPSAVRRFLKTCRELRTN